MVAELGGAGGVGLGANVTGVGIAFPRFMCSVSVYQKAWYGFLLNVLCEVIYLGDVICVTLS